MGSALLMSFFLYTQALLFLDGKHQVPFSWAMDQVNPNLALVWGPRSSGTSTQLRSSSKQSVVALHSEGALQAPVPRLACVSLLCVPRAHPRAKGVCDDTYLVAQCISPCSALSIALGTLLLGVDLLLGLLGSFAKFTGAVFHSLAMVPVFQINHRD